MNVPETSVQNQGESVDLTASVSAFVGPRSDYYVNAFTRIEEATKFPWSWNFMAFLCGPLWGASRGLWGYFWLFLVLELFALVQLGRGLWGDLGADLRARYERLQSIVAQRQEEARQALEAGDQVTADTALKVAENLALAAEQAREQADAVADETSMVLLMGVALLVLFRIAEGFYANMLYERQYLRWRADSKVTSGFSMMRVGYGVLLIAGIVPLTLYRFTVADPYVWITKFPISKEYFSPISNWLEGWFDWLAVSGSGVFDGITGGIRAVLDGLEVVLVQTPWPVVMLVILVIAFRLAGVRVAIFTAAALAYLAFLGLWEVSMVTVSLLGAAALLCVVIGIPLGIWFGKSPRAYGAALPVLDFMQTMPAFVYLIPIIAFFGTGKPPGVLATIIFGMPPVVRLTALGMRQVPESTKEAARAFGCSKAMLLRDVEIPLAMPSIMTGINQTILMCLSMVVIASLIGAGGLGKNVLEALQYAAKGQGIVAGLAILFCAMVIDRIVQGYYTRMSGGMR